MKGFKCSTMATLFLLCLFKVLFGPTIGCKFVCHGFVFFDTVRLMVGEIVSFFVDVNFVAP